MTAWQDAARRNTGKRTRPCASACAKLEKALAYSRLETEARDVMIDIAEREYEISIRKKHGAKQ